MYRATAALMSRAVEAVITMQEQQGITLWAITAYRVAVHHARQADGLPLSIPNDNTTTLDTEKVCLGMQQQQNDTDTDYGEIEVQLFGAWIKIPVRISSLRTVLRLPQLAIFTSGVFHGYTPQFSEPGGEDIPDLDHVQFIEHEHH
ncbi:hypothetical protein JG687_00015873 [Phytophthora cactorum]|uniref:Uncharacterized protein n=1 Tax=Phytophthora cactorum TaxID=29920 RepID=A0A8T1TSK0_9STRA|nr:hypothetical protein JG687_00015873 [Phytophthora cactorum]